MKLSESFLCVNCEEVHEELECPKCFSKSNLSLRKILNPPSAKRKFYEAKPKNTLNTLLSSPNAHLCSYNSRCG